MLVTLLPGRIVDEFKSSSFFRIRNGRLSLSSIKSLENERKRKKERNRKRKEERRKN